MNSFAANEPEAFGRWTKAYCSAWTIITTLAVVVGIGAAMISLDLMAVASVFLAGIVIAGMFAVAFATGINGPWSKVAGYCTYGGVAAVAFFGLLALIGGWAVCLAMVLGSCAPRVLEWLSSEDGGTSPSRVQGAASTPEVTDLRIQPASLDNAALPRAWRASGVALSKSRSPRSTLALVRYREQVLDELESRFPFASIKWLGEGPPPGVDVRTYLPPAIDRLSAS